MKTFSALLVLCEENSPATGEFPSQRPVTRSFDVFFDLRLNKQLSKQWRRRWFKTSARSLWRHGNDNSDTWVARCLKSSATRLFVLERVQASIKANIKALYYRALRREPTCDGGIPLTNGQQCGMSRGHHADFPYTNFRKTKHDF